MMKTMITTTTRDHSGTSLWNNNGIFGIVVAAKIVAVIHVRRRPPDVDFGRRGYLDLVILRACADTQSERDDQQCRGQKEDDR